MAIKTIKYEVNIAGITPATEQFGGTQGDHRVTQLKFALSEELYGAITDAAADGKARYRFDVYDGEGGVWSSDAVELADDTVSIELEERHTRFGGKITVYLVITALSEDNEAEVELYSFPAVLRLKNRPEGVYQDGENYESVTALAEVAKSSALAAEASNQELQGFAAEIEEKLKNGEFDGVGVESAEIIGDELIITYTDGVVENLGNVKGDKGDIGPQGEKGDAGKDAVTDQTYSPTSENAQSGIAVAEAVQEAKDKCVPIPDYEETNDIEKVMVYDDHDYLEDENHNRYVNPKRFKSRPIDDGKGEDYETGLTGSKADTANRAGYIAARDGNGNLWTGTPVDDQDCVPFKMVQNIQENVVILQSETLKRSYDADGMHENVYANDAYGNQTTIQIEDHSLFESEGASGVIPRRQVNGNLHTNTPVKDIDCANKKYVDDVVGEKQNTLVSGTNIKTINGESILGGGNIASDQTYNPESENAQSGKAVAEAVGGKVGWNTLINTTLTADNAGISEVLVALPQDFFEYKVLHLKIGVPYSTTMSSNTIKQNIGICDAAAAVYFGYIAYAIPNSSTHRETGMFNFVANLALTEQETKYTVVSTYIASLAADVGANAQGKANITLVTFDKQNFEKRPPYLSLILTNGTYEEGTEIVVEGLK